MNVLMVGAGKPPSTFIRRQINALEASGVTVSTFPEFGSHKFLNTLLCRNGFLFHLPASTIELVKAADIVHYQWPSHLITFYPMARSFKKRTVLSLRGRQINVLPHLPGQEKYVARMKSMLPRCDAYHCVSGDILREARQFGLAPERAWVIRPAVDTSFFTPVAPPPPASPARIVMVGALIWRKGYEYALLAVRKLVKRGLDVELTIVGEGPERERVLYTVSDLDLEGRVTLAGSLAPEGVRAELHRSHVFLMTSLSEGIANVALEAMACGLPVVTTDATGMREAVADGEQGFVVPLRGVDELAVRLEDLVRSPELRGSMGGKARDRAVREFDLRDQGRKFLSMYESLLN